MASNLVENDVELAALDWFQGLGYSALHGPHIAPGEPSAERDTFGDVVLVGRLRKDLSQPKTLDLWVVGDQIRKGAALNAVQISELLFPR